MRPPGSYGLMVIQLKKVHPSQPWQALYAAVALDPTIGKIIVAVDDDIDPNDADAVNWAMAYRMRPHLDTHVVTGKAIILDPSSAPPEAHVDEQRFPQPGRNLRRILIDATRKWDYPPTSLPRKEFMDSAMRALESGGTARADARRSRGLATSWATGPTRRARTPRQRSRAAIWSAVRAWKRRARRLPCPGFGRGH